MAIEIIKKYKPEEDRMKREVEKFAKAFRENIITLINFSLWSCRGFDLAGCD